MLSMHFSTLLSQLMISICKFLIYYESFLPITLTGVTYLYQCKNFEIKGRKVCEIFPLYRWPSQNRNGIWNVIRQFKTRSCEWKKKSMLMIVLDFNLILGILMAIRIQSIENWHFKDLFSPNHKQSN